MEAPNEKTKELVELLELMRVILKHAKKVDPKKNLYDQVLMKSLKLLMIRWLMVWIGWKGLTFLNQINKS